MQHTFRQKTGKKPLKHEVQKSSMLQRQNQVCHVVTGKSQIKSWRQRTNLWLTEIYNVDSNLKFYHKSHRQISDLFRSNVKSNPTMPIFLNFVVSTRLTAENNMHNVVAFIIFLKDWQVSAETWTFNFARTHINPFIPTFVLILAKMTLP